MKVFEIITDVDSDEHAIRVVLSTDQLKELHKELTKLLEEKDKKSGYLNMYFQQENPVNKNNRPYMTVGFNAIKNMGWK